MAIPDIDLMDPKVFSNGIPYDYFRQLRQSDRLTQGRDTDGEQFWNVVRHCDVAAVSRHTAVFSTSPTTMTSVRKIDSSKGDTTAASSNQIIAFLDGPPHIRLRKLTHKAFAPARVATLEARTKDIVDSLLAEAVQKGEFDMAADVALRLPFEVLADVLGVAADDREMVLEWARQSINLGDPDFDATASQASIFKLDELRADRTLLPSAVDEILRWVTPVTHFARNVVSDTEIAGQQIRAGERVVLWYTSANRDEEVFAEPDRFDIARTPNPHLSFGGGGPHVCMGIGLAVMAVRQFLESAIDLLPRLEITGTPVRPETNFMNSVKHLPMRFR